MTIGTNRTQKNDKPMKAILSGENNDINSNHRKEHNYSDSYLLLHMYKGEIKQAATVNFYYTTSRCYCCLWIHARRDNEPGYYTGGSDFAGGYGYHKASAAFHGALNNAGIDITKNISGVGATAIIEALQAIGKALKLKKITVIHSNG